MKIKSLVNKIIAASLFVSLPVNAQNPSGQGINYDRSNSIIRCDYPSYLITSDGYCLDLTYLNGKGNNANNSLVRKFLIALNQLKIPVKRINCENSNEVAFYDFRKNVMSLCTNNVNFNKDQDFYIETLAHESWHVVQDCIGGLNNPRISPVSVLKPELFNRFLRELKLGDVNNIKSNYSAAEQMFEVEAYAMEKHPEVVLEALQQCKANQ